MTDVFSSPIGLGHVTRNAAIANYFEKLSSKFITGGSAAKFLAACGFVDYVYNSPNFSIQDGLLQNLLTWIWKYKYCKLISSKIIQKNKPKLVISDEDFVSLLIAQ